MMRAARFVVLLVALLVVLPMVPAHAAVAPRGLQTICVKVHASIKPRPIHVGDDMFVFGDWENCGRSAYMRFVFGLRAPDRCEGQGHHEDYHYRLRKGEGIGEILGGQVVCAGDYRLTAKAYHDGAVIGRATHWVHVLP
jgi:hypothetical protein